MKPADTRAVAAPCRCKPERLSPHLLRQAPELAVLATLEAVLAASACALLAAYPELDEEDFAASPQLPSAQACLADALLTQVHSVRDTPGVLGGHAAPPATRRKLRPLSTHSSHPSGPPRAPLALGGLLSSTSRQLSYAMPLASATSIHKRGPLRTRRLSISPTSLNSLTGGSLRETRPTCR